MNRKLVLFLLVATAFFNQLSAQEPAVIRIAEWGSEARHMKAAQTERELLDSVVYVETYDGIIYNGDKKVWEYGSDGLTEHFSWYYWSTDAEAWKGRQRMDSIFDANGRLSMYSKNSWDSNTSQWKQENKIELNYSPDGEVILYADYLWNAVINEWVWRSKTENTHSYTKDGMHIIFSINYTYDTGTKEWIPHHRNEINYDSNGNQTLYNASFFDSGSNTWVFKTGSFKYEKAYNEQGKITLSSYYLWDSGKNQWTGQGNLLESGYDFNGNKTSVVTKNWDVASNQWVNFSKTENRYNEQEDVTEINTSEWDNEKSVWVVLSKQELLYDAHRNVSKYLVLLLDTTSNEWYTSTKDEFTYDVNNHETLKEQYKRNEESQLVLYKKKETAYDAYGNVILTANYELDKQSGNFIKKYDTRYTFNESSDKIIEETTSYYDYELPYIVKNNYYYSLHAVSSIDTQKETQSSFVYPGLFTDKLSFQLNNTNNQYAFELFNSQGQIVLSKWVKDSETINVENLPRGVYLYTLSLDNSVLKGKLIKK